MTRFRRFRGAARNLLAEAANAARQTGADRTDYDVIFGPSNLVMQSTDCSVVAEDYVAAAVAFSPDGHTLASASSDRTVRLWIMNVDQAIQRICTTTTTTTRNILTRTKWDQYVSQDLPYRPPCP